MPANADLLFGQIAMRLGYINQVTLDSVLAEQHKLELTGIRAPIGKLLLAKGALNEEQVGTVLTEQFTDLRHEDKRLGRLAIRNQFATEEDVQRALAAQKADFNATGALPDRLGAYLLKLGILNGQQMTALLRIQERLACEEPAPDAAAAAATAPLSPSDIPTEVPSSHLRMAPPPAAAPARPVNVPPCRLVEEKGEDPGRTIELAASATLGRQSGNEVVLKDTQLSRQHAIIKRTADGFRIADLGSKNGTIVNGSPIASPRLLKPGDRIQIGRFVFRFELSAATVQVSAAPAAADEALVTIVDAPAQGPVPPPWAAPAAPAARAKSESSPAAPATPARQSTRVTAPAPAPAAPAPVHRSATGRQPERERGGNGPSPVAPSGPPAPPAAPASRPPVPVAPPPMEAAARAKPFPAPGVCPGCGTPAGPKDRFCESCGQPLGAPAAPAPVPAPRHASAAAPAPSPRSAPPPSPAPAIEVAAFPGAGAPEPSAPAPAPAAPGTCPHCGTPATVEDRFCGGCGRQVAPPAPAPAAPASAARSATGRHPEPVDPDSGRAQGRPPRGATASPASAPPGAPAPPDTPDPGLRSEAQPREAGTAAPAGTPADASAPASSARPAPTGVVCVALYLFFVLAFVLLLGGTALTPSLRGNWRYVATFMAAGGAFLLGLCPVTLFPRVPFPVLFLAGLGWLFPTLALTFLRTLARQVGLAAISDQLLVAAVCCLLGQCIGFIVSKFIIRRV